MPAASDKENEFQFILILFCAEFALWDYVYIWLKTAVLNHKKIKYIVIEIPITFKWDSIQKLSLW